MGNIYHLRNKVLYINLLIPKMEVKIGKNKNTILDKKACGTYLQGKKKECCP